VRSSGAAAYRDLIARLQSTDDDDGEAAVDTAQAKKRRVPQKPVDNEDRRQYLTEREVEQLCDAARKRGRYGHRDATMILMAYRHGLRVSELVAPQWAQVDLEAGRLQVIRRKGSDDSVQPLSGGEIRAWRKIRREQPAGLRHVFVSERERRLLRTGSSRRLVGPPPASAWATFIRTCCAMRAAESWSTMGSTPAPWRPISGIARLPTRPAIRRWTHGALPAFGRIEAAGRGTRARGTVPSEEGGRGGRSLPADRKVAVRAALAPRRPGLLRRVGTEARLQWPRKTRLARRE